MTSEEAIEIFEGMGELEGISMFYQPGGKAGKLTIHGIKEASQMAISALRTQHAKLDRSRWEGCKLCNEPTLAGFTTYCGYRYCKNCGRPLTGEARAQLERRINGGTTDQAI